MTPSVHILATCRNPELFDATTLVFKTIRVGFPSAKIFVHDNHLLDKHLQAIIKLCRSFDIQWEFRGGHERIVHHEWIRRCIEQQEGPFFICDTDQVFHASMERFEFEGPLHGRLIPSFRCPFTRTIAHERLHTSLLYIDPQAIRDAEQKLTDRLNPRNPFGTGIDLISPLNYARDHDIYFHDTLSQAYHAIGGNSFSEEQLNSYDHLGCGTYLDLLEERIPGSRERQETYLKYPQTIRGLWKQQETYFLANAA